MQPFSKQRFIDGFSVLLMTTMVLGTSLLFFGAASVKGKSVKAGKPIIHKPPRDKLFYLFNAIHYKNTPDLSKEFVHRLNLVYESRLLSPDPLNPKDLVPNKDSIREIASRLSLHPEIPVTLDIEAWKYGTSDLATTLQRYLEVIALFKQANPRSPMGYYGVVPKTAFEWKMIEPPGSVHYLNWQRLNQAVRPLAKKIDIVFPSFYTFDDDREAWKNMVMATLEEIKKYNLGLPVYAYLWPQYHENTARQWQFLDAGLWKFELETLYPLVDGIVIWSSNKGVNGNMLSWDESMPWWQVTQSFIQEHGIK